MMANKAELQVKICDFGLATLHQNVYCLTSQCGTDNYGKFYTAKNVILSNISVSGPRDS